MRREVLLAGLMVTVLTAGACNRSGRVRDSGRRNDDSPQVEVEEPEALPPADDSGAANDSAPVVDEAPPESEADQQANAADDQAVDQPAAEPTDAPAEEPTADISGELEALEDLDALLGGLEDANNQADDLADEP